MPHFAAGVVKFQNEVFPSKKALFERLSLGQTPEALFITCSDSRIETAMITQTDPGELFVCRNAGNIVPPHKEDAGGITASIEFAVSVLKVPHIVICGHTHCGAMHGAMHPETVSELPHVREWLGFAQPAVERVKTAGANLDEEQQMHLLLEENVMLQMEHIASHPSVAKGLENGNLQLHGWVYDIKTGCVLAYDETEKRFLSVEKRYAAEIAKISK